MSSSSSSSSSITPSYPSSLSRTNSLPLMANLFSAAKGSDVALQEEMQKTSHSVSVFMKQTEKQLEASEQRCLALEGKLVTVERERQEAIRMNEALKQSITDLTTTVMAMNVELATLKSSVAKVNELEKNFNSHTHSYTYTYTPPGGFLMPVGQSSSTGLAKY